MEYRHTKTFKNGWTIHSKSYYIKDINDYEELAVLYDQTVGKAFRRTKAEMREGLTALQAIQRRMRLSETIEAEQEFNLGGAL